MMTRKIKEYRKRYSEFFYAWLNQESGDVRLAEVLDALLDYTRVLEDKLGITDKLPGFKD